MKRIMITAILAFVFVFAFAVARVTAQEMMSKSGETSEASKLLGKSVKNSQGEDLGTITNVVTGPEGGVAFVVVRYWISDNTQKRVAVPFGRLSCKEQDCVLNMSKEALGSAPVFVFEEDLVEPKLAEEIYRYFGVQPYWPEERIQE